MSNKISNHPDHEEIFSLLPWYVNLTLDEGQRGAVSSHIKNCDECQREIQFLESLSETVKIETEDAYSTHVDVDKSLANVMNRIDEESHQTNAVASGASSLLNQLGEFFKFATTLPVTQWGATALAGLLVAVLGFQVYFSQSNDDYSVLSSSDITDSSMRLSVEMSTAVGLQQAQSIIEQGVEKLGQRIDIEAKADSVYTVIFKDSIAVPELSKLIADLESDAQVKRVEILP
ncbi:anti-sigma factor family protein [Granulosicoccus antarcticus]|uniref:Zinc-finger domain-containing protein n=1 Tax=Granulosicoccus antarcticus IMCC3135 TaxID=1192854 RepID=A0A2Z2NQC7_9GAMM|nr:hypothetical protein [Granulosicoccus antarcticus]ASJ73533.1 hypothetical protein IMCC3135_17255 [Granulosicoccus antarcticus IMCC3135]